MVFIDYQLDRRLSRTMIGFLDSKDLNSPSHFLISRQDQLRLIFQWWVWAPTNQAYYSHLRQPTYLKLLPLEKEGHRAYQAEIQGGTSEATEGKAQKHCNLILPCRNKVFRLFLLLTWRAENRKWFHKWRNEKPCLVCGQLSQGCFEELFIKIGATGKHLMRFSWINNTEGTKLNIPSPCGSLVYSIWYHGWKNFNLFSISHALRS